MAGSATGLHARSTMRTAVVWTVLRDALAALATDRGEGKLHVLDAGGGTGGFAVPLAGLGHEVTVVDPSPDSLAALERRAAEAGLAGAIHAVQGDAAQLPDLVAPDSVDAVLCHSVLEVVDDPALSVAAVARVLRPGGVASVLVAGRVAAVVGRAIAGHFAEAAQVLHDEHGRFGPGDALARRFTEPEVTGLLSAVGLKVRSVHAVRVFSDLVPGGLLDDPSASEALLALEEAVASRPEFRALATQLHVLALRP